MLTIGLIVYLMSGSPPLTVTGVDGTNIEVRWFDGRGYQSQVIPNGALTQVDPSIIIEHTKAKEEAQLKIDDPIPEPPAKSIDPVTP